MRQRPQRNPASAVLAAADAVNAGTGAPEQSYRVHLIGAPIGSPGIREKVALCGEAVPSVAQRCVAATHQICPACQGRRAQGVSYAAVLFPKP